MRNKDIWLLLHLSTASTFLLLGVPSEVTALSLSPGNNNRPDNRRHISPAWKMDIVREPGVRIMQPKASIIIPLNIDLLNDAGTAAYHKLKTLILSPIANLFQKLGIYKVIRNRWVPVPLPIPSTMTSTTNTPYTTTTTTSTTTTPAPNNTHPITSCTIDNDLVIVLDSSASVSENDYRTALNFTAELSVQWKSHGGNRLAMTVFSNEVKTVLNLWEALDLNETEHKIMGAPHLGRGTFTHVALEDARRKLTNTPRGVPALLLFLTDGRSRHPKLTLSAAKRLAEENISAFSVGIGPDHLLDKDELAAIANWNEDRVYILENFSTLGKMVTLIAEAMCPVQ